MITGDKISKKGRPHGGRTQLLIQAYLLQRDSLL